MGRVRIVVFKYPFGNRNEIKKLFSRDGFPVTRQQLVKLFVGVISNTAEDVFEISERFEVVFFSGGNE